MPKSAKPRFTYLLGDSPEESRRLERQALLWDPVAHALFDRLKIKPGARILEIGPGRGSLHLELRRRARRPIDAVERSLEFADGLKRLTEQDSFGPGIIHNCNLLDAEIPDHSYDLIFARWVFLFLPRPEAHLKKLVRALKPGGKLVLQDYHRETLAMIPRARHWEEFLAADRAFFAAEGGNASIADDLPALFRKVGLEKIQTSAHIKSGHPGEPTWNWLSDYFLGIFPRYQKIAPLNARKTQALTRDWKKNAKRADSLLIAPTLVDIIGTRPRR